jgi:hypothetical protein
MRQANLRKTVGADIERRTELRPQSAVMRTVGRRRLTAKQRRYSRESTTRSEPRDRSLVSPRIWPVSVTAIDHQGLASECSCPTSLGSWLPPPSLNSFRPSGTVPPIHRKSDRGFYRVTFVWQYSVVVENRIVRLGNSYFLRRTIILVSEPEIGNGC